MGRGEEGRSGVEVGELEFQKCWRGKRKLGRGRSGVEGRLGSRVGLPLARLVTTRNGSRRRRRRRRRREEGGGGAGLTRAGGAAAARDPGRCYRPAGGSYDGAEAARARGGRLNHRQHHHQQQQRHYQRLQLQAHPPPRQQSGWNRRGLLVVLGNPAGIGWGRQGLRWQWGAGGWLEA